MANYTEWDRLVNLFRPASKSPNIAKAFDEAKKHSIRQDAELTALAASAPPASNVISVNPPRPTITTVNDVVIGLNIANQTDALWDDYDISFTADSGVIMGPIAGDPVTTLSRFKLRTIGGRTTGHPAYAIHGIYCKRPNTLIEDFDCEIAAGNGDNLDGLSLRKRGIVVDRGRIISPNAWCISYFEEDTVAGTVTVKNVYGTSVSNVGVWTGLNTEATVRQSFWFENVHFTVTGGSYFIGCSAGEYTGAGVTIKNCTINGAKVLSGNVQNMAPLTIINN